MTAATATTNGKPPARKQLSDQLDRLDSIIDALAEGLNAAVADACREGARAAVREVLMELISNPDLVAAVRATATSATLAPSEVTPPAPAGTSFWGRVKDVTNRAGRAVTGAARTLVKSVEGAARPAADTLRLTGTGRTVVAVAAGVGLAAGLATLACPTWVGAVLAAATGAGAVAAAHVGAAVNRICAPFRAA